MSLFRRPKKPVVNRRVFSAADDDEHSENFENENISRKNGEETKMDVDSRVSTPPPPCISESRKPDKKSSKDDKKISSKKTSLLSFGHEEGESKCNFKINPLIFFAHAN